MPRKATPSKLTPTMSRTLQQIVNSSTDPKSVSVRARVVLMASTGNTNQVAEALGITTKTVRESNLKPHKSRYWCNTTETDPVLFEQQVETVCQTYLDAPELFVQYNTRTSR